MSIRVLNMQPHKDPDEFIKNMGAEAFRERIEQARNSFLFEIDVLKRNYEMDDPEQKTEFYNQVAKKLCEFPEALERENYLEAVSREFFINYEDLKRLVNRMGARLGPVLRGRKKRILQERRKRTGKTEEISPRGFSSHG